jgi:membrane-associated phospholipid phosphatase
MRRPEDSKDGLVSAWKSAWADVRFRYGAIATPIVLLTVLRLYARLLGFVEQRPGAVLPDPVLAYLEPRDVSWLTFALVYGVMLVGVTRLSAHPRALVIGTQAYVLMTLLRMVTLYVTPLDPPPGMIALRDPFTEHITVGALLTRDLFFSGHTATVFLFALGVPGKWVPRAFLLCAVAVGIAVLVQHVHYALDVVGAPLAAFAAYRMTVWINGVMGPTNPPS